MKVHFIRQFISRYAVYDEKGKYEPPKDPILRERLGHAKNLLRKMHKAERQRKRILRRKVKGLH